MLINYSYLNAFIVIARHVLQRLPAYFATRDTVSKDQSVKRLVTPAITVNKNISSILLRSLGRVMK